MVTCTKVEDQVVAVPKMNSVRRPRKPSSNSSSGFRLLDGDHLETSSSVSKNSVYKLKIDLMFDDTRSIRSNRLDDPRGSHRTRSIIMYGRSELASTAGESSRSITSFLQQESNESSSNKPHATTTSTHSTKKDVQRISNTVQAQIEQLFTDVAKDATSSFAVMYLGSLPLKDKVTSLQGLQEPLRELYLKEVMTNEKRNSGSLDICTTGLRVKINASTDSNSSGSGVNEENITPFHNIAVWSAVKFVVSEKDGGAAFLPLITDPENIDKTSLFRSLSPAEQKRVAHSAHAPIFAVVMRSAGLPKVLECHGFICKSTEDAIVIAATLYQSLMAHVSSNSHRSTKRRTPRNQNGVSCISIASSSAQTGSNYLARSQIVSSGRKSSGRSSSTGGGGVGVGGSVVGGGPNTPASRSGRKKRVSNSSLSSNSNIINEAAETTTEERKRKSHKSKRAPPVPNPNAVISAAAAAAAVASTQSSSGGRNRKPHANGDIRESNKAYLDSIVAAHSHINGGIGNKSLQHRPSSSSSHHHGKKSLLSDSVYRASEIIGAGATPGVVAAAATASGGNGIRNNDMTNNGDILTRVAIPRSGSFLNTGGLTRYKSRAARRHSGKLGGGGGGSPLGFSELFNEFRLHENLHSLDDILYAIIDADGMSFNDLKPIYKEFLLKLAVTLTKDELFQRSKNIMRRQKKKKLKRKSSSATSQKKPRTLIFGTKSLKKVFQLGQFRSCRGKPPKPPRNREQETKRKSGNSAILIGSPIGNGTHHSHQQRSRVATSGSDVSLVRNENTFPGLNRNSSSGYVSCSECSYDSEACTCVSADRCYCSLRNENVNNKLRRKNERNAALSKKSSGSSNHNRSNQIIYAPGGRGSGGNNVNRHSLISCKSDDKCYCSMVEEEPNTVGEDDSANAQSDTTWCDTDSCISASKCYCKRNTERRASHQMGSESEHSQRQQRHSRSSARKPSDKLALDYELFTISGNGKSVQPHEALSVKKSVEAAAIFADVKLSQTTDIKSMCPPPGSMRISNGGNSVNGKSAAGGSCRSYNSSSKKYAHSYKKRESFSIDRTNERNPAMISLSSSSSQKSCSADDLLSKLSAIEKAVGNAASIHSASHKNRDLLSHFAAKANFQNNYQSMRAVSASLEDTLGYLP